MKKPNSQQLAAIHHTVGPALVLAGPGSGKTFTIIQRIFFLIQKQKIPPENILVVTFSKAAAKEMQMRYQNVVRSQPFNGHVHFATFHSLGFHILQDACHLPSNALVSESEKRKYLEVLLKNHGCTELCHYDKIHFFLDYFSRLKNNPDCSVNLSLLSVSKEFFQQIYLEFQSFLREQQKIDFDDMILQCIEFLQKDSHLLKKYQNQFSYLLVDEFQDINISQYQMIQLLSEKSGNLYVVGDDDQAIYGFRGSSPDIMQKFQMDYRNAVTYPLTSNFRSGEQIVRFADRVIVENRQRFEKTFQPECSGGIIFHYHCITHKDEEELLVTHLKKHSCSCYEQTAVILRTNQEVFLFAELLKQHGIPVHCKEPVFQIYDSFVMEDIFSFLCFLYEGHRREYFLNFMNKPNHYFQRGALTSDVVSCQMMTEYYRYHSQMQQNVTKYFQKIHLAERLSPPLAVRYFCQEMGYLDYLKEKSSSPAEFSRFKKAINEIQLLLEDYHFQTSIHKFIEEKRKAKERPAEYVTNKGVHVITMHASKGLEFEHVYLPDLNEGIIPFGKLPIPEELEEERRLLYVAITRAKNKLFLYETEERNRKISRFIQHLIPQNPEIHQIPVYPDIHQTHLQLPHIPHHH